MKKKKLLFIFGTRPEAIKLAPLIKAFRRENAFEVVVCCTGQHNSLLDDAIGFFDIQPDIDLKVMQPNQSLYQLSARILERLEAIFKEVDPHLVFVQGDTTSAYIGALAAFYAKKEICHIEAGLRTNDKARPFPEELNRRMISQLADYHFTPTYEATANLLGDGIKMEVIFQTGNTIIDALCFALEQTNSEDFFREIGIDKSDLVEKKLILATLHRRENQGVKLEKILESLVKISEWPDTHVIFIIHPNPRVAEPAKAILSNRSDITLLESQPYQRFVQLMQSCDLIMTDSGGVQEEATYLGKPLMVLRQKTERSVGVYAGSSILAGTSGQLVIGLTAKILNEEMKFSTDQRLIYGDGKASERIVDKVKQVLG
jgi:UDP-N-acetylglucosamine 2-epimerase (non-hydrolysing)